MDRSGERLRQMRFELPQLRPCKHRIVDAVFFEGMRVCDTLQQSLLCAAAVEPTSMGHEALSRAANLGNQRVVLLDALRHQPGRALASIVRPVRGWRSASIGKAKVRSAAAPTDD